MMKNKIFLSVFCIVLIFFSSLTLANVINVKLATPNLDSLGRGYSDDGQRDIMWCLLPVPLTYSGNKKTVVLFNEPKSFDEIQKELEVDVTSSLRADLYRSSYDMSTEFASIAQGDAYTKVFLYEEKVILPTLIFQPTAGGTDILNGTGLRIYQINPEQFRLSCGNKFLQQTTAGINVFLALVVHFNSALDKENFETHLGQQDIGNITEAANNIEALARKYGINGKMGVLLLQIGGHLYAGNSGAKIPISAPGFCPLTDVSYCKDFINKELEFARTDIPGQVDFDPQSQTIIGEAASLTHGYLEYIDFHLNMGKTKVTPEVLAARLKLGDLYKRYQQQHTLVYHLLHSSLAVPLGETSLNSILEKLESNLSILDNDRSGVVEYCYWNAYLEDCPASADTLIGLLKPIDDQVIAVFQTGFKLTAEGQDWYFAPVKETGIAYADIKEPNSLIEIKLAADQSRIAINVDQHSLLPAGAQGELLRQPDGTYVGKIKIGDKSVIWVLHRISNPV